jgi:hypothetical protein
VNLDVHASAPALAVAINGVRHSFDAEVSGHIWRLPGEYFVGPWTGQLHLKGFLVGAHHGHGSLTLSVSGESSDAIAYQITESSGSFHDAEGAGTFSLLLLAPTNGQKPTATLKFA